MSRLPHSRRVGSCSGFTLVELLVTIVIAAVVMSFVVLFLDTPVESYFAQTRRADLSDSASRIAQAVTTDARTALPNSLRVAGGGNRWALEMLATDGVARYYGAGEKTGDPTAANEELSLGSADGSFYTMSPFTSDTGPYTAARAPYLSVGNLGLNPLGGQDAYDSGPFCATRPCAMSAVGNSPRLTTRPQGEQWVRYGPMTFVSNGISNGHPDHNAYLVSSPVSYVCDAGAGTLTRYSGYAASPAQPVPPAVQPGMVAAVIAHDVTGCGPFSVVSARLENYQFGQIAILNVTLSSGGESVQVFVQAPTEYTQ
jgi:MSHA biogenesis protein MshO